MASIQVQRIALLAGCNYPGTPHKLKGCINDVRNIQPVLIKRFGFQSSDVKLLIDDPSSGEEQPTGANIKKHLMKMIEVARKGDLVLFYFSGHGMQDCLLYSNKLDEAIVPTDYNVIMDEDFRNMLKKLDEGATFVFISDSCHSGGLLDKGEMINLQKSIDKINDQRQRAKFLPLKALEEHLKTSLPVYLARKFTKDDASLKLISSNERDLLPDIKEKGILLSACLANEVSWDLEEPDGVGFGAFSRSLRRILEANPQCLKNKQTLELVQEEIKKLEFPQHPTLYCGKDQDKESIFLLQQKDYVCVSDNPVPNESQNSTNDSPGRNKGWAMLNDLTQAALAYYRISTRNVKTKVDYVFKRLQENKGGSVKTKDAFDLFDFHNKAVREKLSKQLGMDKPLDFNSFLAVYYASKSTALFCQICEAMLNPFHFTCVTCFKEHHETYNICSNCITAENARCFYSHTLFLDNQALLETYHFHELKTSVPFDGQRGTVDLELKKELKAAGETFLTQSGAAQTSKGSLAVQLGIQADDICSIM